VKRDANKQSNAHATSTIGPAREPKPTANQLPTLAERKRKEGPRRPTQLIKPTLAAPGERFVNRPGHLLEPAAGYVESPGKVRAGVLQKSDVGKRSPITRADRSQNEKAAFPFGGKSPEEIGRAIKNREQPALSTSAPMTLGQRVRQEGVAAYGERFKKPPAKDPSDKKR
jgi:hypothetical protein